MDSEGDNALLILESWASMAGDRHLSSSDPAACTSNIKNLKNKAAKSTNINQTFIVHVKVYLDDYNSGLISHPEFYGPWDI